MVGFLFFPPSIFDCIAIRRSEAKISVKFIYFLFFLQRRTLDGGEVGRQLP